MNTDIFKQFGAELDAQSAQPLGQPTSRRKALGQFGKLGFGAAAAAFPLFGMAEKAHAAKYGSFGGGGNDLSDPQILNFALTLEWLEYFFYVKGTRDGDILDADLPLFNEIREHEDEHVILLTSVLDSIDGVDPVVFEEDDFDFTVDGADPFGVGNYPLFLALSQGLEDTGVRAYKGQAASISGAARGGLDSVLTTALRIHSVEARHAAAVRMVRGNLPYITGDFSDNMDGMGSTNPAIEATYAGEDNVTQGGVNLVDAFSDYSRDNITEAFDEPLNDEEVLAIASNFFAEED